MRCSVLLIGIAAAATIGGCSGGPEPAANPAPEQVEGWWNNPGAFKDVLAAVGAATVMNDKTEHLARTAAEVNGRAQVAATLRAKIQSLTENWSKEVGDYGNPESFQSLANNENLVRQVVDATIAGAHVHKYQRVKDTMYALVVLKDPTQWSNSVISELENQALKDNTLWKTEALKRDFEAKMDRLRNEQTQQSQAEQQTIERLAGSGQSGT